MDGAKATKRDGVAVIPIHGGISRYTTLMEDLGCGGASVESLAKDLRVALDDPHTRAILLDIDSPGGEATGIGELAAQIRSACTSKPVVAYVGGDGCSGAYWLASACEQVVCSESAMLGSIGVVWGMRTVADRPGTKTWKFKSTQSPLKQADPSTEAGKDALQKRCDSLASVFIGNVAKFRGTTPDVVMQDFGRGDVLFGHAAVAVGMADGVSDFETCLGRLAQGLTAVETATPKPTPEPPSPKSVASASADTNPTGKTSMNLFTAMARLFKADPEAAAVFADAEGDAAKDAAKALASLAAGNAPAVVAAQTEEAIRAQIRAELATENAAKLEASFLTAAESLFDGFVRAGKAIPAHKAAFVAQHVAASMEDAAKGPLTVTTPAGTTTVTRVSAVLAAVQAPATDKTGTAVSDSAAATAALAGLTPLSTDAPGDAATKAAAEAAATKATALKGFGS
jgi:ClpP class serine protease